MLEAKLTLNPCSSFVSKNTAFFSTCKIVTQNSNKILKLYLLNQEITQYSPEQSSLFLPLLLVSLQRVLSADGERVKHREDVRVQQQHAAYVPEKRGTSPLGLELSIHIMITRWNIQIQSQAMGM